MMGTEVCAAFLYCCEGLLGAAWLRKKRRERAEKKVGRQKKRERRMEESKR